MGGGGGGAAVCCADLQVLKPHPFSLTFKWKQGENVSHDLLCSFIHFLCLNTDAPLPASIPFQSCSVITLTIPTRQLLRFQGSYGEPQGSSKSSTCPASSRTLENRGPASLLAVSVRGHRSGGQPATESVCPLSPRSPISRVNSLHLSSTFHPTLLHSEGRG